MGRDHSKGSSLGRFLWTGLCGLVASTLMMEGADAWSALSSFRSEFHRFSATQPSSQAGQGPWASHDVSADLVNWRDAGLPLPAEPLGRVLGACGVEDPMGRSGLGPKGVPLHVSLAVVEAEVPSVCLSYSLDGRSYVRHAANPVLRLPGASGGGVGIVSHPPSGRWVMGIPVQDARGPGLQFVASSNWVDWQVLGRLEGEYARGGLCDLPVRGTPPATRWIVADSTGRLRAGTFDGQQFVADGRRLETVRGQARWGFVPVPGVVPPAGRRLVVGTSKEGDAWQGGLPWQLVLDGTETALQMRWEPCVEAEWLRSRSRLFEIPRGPRAETNRLDVSLPPAFELRMELRSSPHLRLVLRLAGDVVQFSGPRRELTLGTTTVALPPPGDFERIVIMRTPHQIEVLASEGRVRVVAATRFPEAGGPLVIERPGGWWMSINPLVLHPLSITRPPTPAPPPP